MHLKCAGDTSHPYSPTRVGLGVPGETLAARTKKPSPEDHAALQGFLADEIRFRRERIGLSREEFARLAAIAPTTVASYENGHRPLNAQFVFRSDEIFDADGALTRMWERASTNERTADGFPWYIELEQQASVIRTYENMLVPGLLQTEEYARRLLQAYRPALTNVQVDRKVAQRLARQEIFHSQPAVQLRFILDEAVLQRLPNVDGIAAGQLGRLLEVAPMEGVSLGVVAFAEGFHPGMIGAFTLLSFEDGGESCYVSSASGARITTDHHQLAAFRERYDGLLAAALPQRQSEDLIRELLENR